MLSPAANLKPWESHAMTAARLLAELRELAPGIAARAAANEADRRMSADLMAELRSIGVFRLFVPQSHGGLELDLPAALEIIRALGRIDGSVGWTAMIASGCAAVAAGLPRDTYDRIYQDGSDVVLAGSSQPAGMAEAVPAGWRVNGRWPFASGCQQAAWMFALCVMTENGRPVAGPAGEAGPPLMRFCCLPARHWRIEDTWHVAGLKATGSHHIALTDAPAEAANFFDPVHGVPCLPGPLYQAALQLLPLLHGACTVGIAEGALDDLVALANTGRRQLRAATAMRDSEIFQGELGRVAAEFRAASALLRTQAASHWRHAVAGTLKDEALHAQGTQTAIWLATTCVRIVGSCFALAGSSALYDTSPLQRRLRDVHAAAQHAAAQQRHYVDAGQLLLRSALADQPSRPRAQATA
jgi:alkylation response protein AidB-like acyl-CoA dehydrogenase